MTSLDHRTTYFGACVVKSGGNAVALLSSGWISSPVVVTSHLGLIGGTSAWRTNAPTIIIELVGVAAPEVTGWVTSSQEPNDDNVGLWFVSAQVEQAWSYQVTATMAP